MINITYYGLDIYLIGELNAKIHSQVAKLFEVDDEEVVFTGIDSFVFYKGHEQTSINLMIKVELEEKYRKYQDEVAKFLLETSKEYSIHAHVFFNYYYSKDSYLSVNEEYPRYLTNENESSEEDYDENKDYSEDDLFTGNIFEGFEEDDEDEGNSFSSAIKK